MKSERIETPQMIFNYETGHHDRPVIDALGVVACEHLLGKCTRNVREIGKERFVLVDQIVIVVGDEVKPRRLGVECGYDNNDQEEIFPSGESDEDGNGRVQNSFPATRRIDAPSCWRFFSIRSYPRSRW